MTAFLLIVEQKYTNHWQKNKTPGWNFTSQQMLAFIFYFLTRLQLHYILQNHFPPLGKLHCALIEPGSWKLDPLVTGGQDPVLSSYSTDLTNHHDQCMTNLSWGLNFDKFIYIYYFNRPRAAGCL